MQKLRNLDYYELGNQSEDPDYISCVLLTNKINQIIDQVNELSSPEKKEEVINLYTASRKELLDYIQHLEGMVEKEEPTQEFSQAELRVIKNHLQEVPIKSAVLEMLLSKIERLLK